MDEPQKKDIKDIVRVVVKELKKSNLLKDEKDAVYSEISKRLYTYYRTGKDAELEHALHEFKDDAYKDVIQMYYRDGRTIEDIAAEMDVDTSTITRNKKRICLGLYLILE